jgi:hypothetical protein
MTRLVRLVLLLAIVAPVTACFQSSTVLHIKGDGSGTIQQRTVVTEAALEQLRAFTILGGGRGGDVDPVSETQARALAATLGPGVTYVSSTPIKTPTGLGREAVYSFADISTVKVSEQGQLPAGAAISAPGLNTAGANITFAMTRQPDGNATLRIVVPKMPIVPSAPGGAAGPTGGFSPTPDQIAMAKQVLAGAHLNVVVEPDGQLVKTSSPYTEGNRVTLIEIDVDQATSDLGFLTKLQAAQNLDEMKAAIAGVPGLKLNLDPEITVEFTPAK